MEVGERGGNENVLKLHDRGSTSSEVQVCYICLPMQGTVGSILGQGTKISQARGQLSLCALIRKKPKYAEMKDLACRS